MKHQVGAIMINKLKHSLEIFVEFNLNRIVVHCLHGLCSTSQCMFTVTGVNTGLSNKCMLTSMYMWFGVVCIIITT